MDTNEIPSIANHGNIIFLKKNALPKQINVALFAALQAGAVQAKQQRTPLIVF